MKLLAFVLGTILVTPAAAASLDLGSSVIPLTDSGRKTFSGQVTAGVSQSFTYKVIKRREVTISIEANNEHCGAELRRDTERGYMPNFGRFPTIRAETFNDGETFKVSFFQTRLAALHRVSCVFSLTIR